MCLSFHRGTVRNRARGYAKIFSLCERTIRSRAALRKEGHVKLRAETPNGLSASATLAKGDRECVWTDGTTSRVTCGRGEVSAPADAQPPMKSILFFACRRFQLQTHHQVLPALTFVRGHYNIKLTAKSCIALYSSKNAVNISSARTMKRFP
jgi:hypothetical protein